GGWRGHRGPAGVQHRPVRAGDGGTAGAAVADAAGVGPGCPGCPHPATLLADATRTRATAAAVECHRGAVSTPSGPARVVPGAGGADAGGRGGSFWPTAVELSGAERASQPAGAVFANSGGRAGTVRGPVSGTIAGAAGRHPGSAQGGSCLPASGSQL